MFITIVGAGALGRIYGVHLDKRGHAVDFVVRAARVAETAPFVIERINGDKERATLARPKRVTFVAPETQIAIVAVRFDQLGSLAVELGKTRGPIVVLTPMFTSELRAIERAVGRRVVAAMPGVAGYVDEHDVVRYWAMGVATTLLDDGAGDRALLEELARSLTAGGLATRLEHNVTNLNAATTVSFFPLIAAIDASGGVDGVLADKDLLHLALDAAKESEALAAKLGKPASWASLLTRFVGPYTLKPAALLAKRIAPESVRFVDEHFGPKLHGQHVAMGEAILLLGREHGVDLPKLEELMVRVRARG